VKRWSMVHLVAVSAEDWESVTVTTEA